MQNAEQKTALIAMSGGVDSSIAAYLMRQADFRCMGTTMRLYRNEDLGACNFRTCCSEKDIEDASEVAFQLDIPYEVLDFTLDFQEKIIGKFVRTYEAGGTPNPCIDCNRFMKFDKLLDFAEQHGLYYVVTGHYARIDRPLAAQKGRGRGQGPELCAVHDDAAAAGAHQISSGRPQQAGDPRAGGAAQLLQRTQARQPGYLLCAGRRLRQVHGAVYGQALSGRRFPRFRRQAGGKAQGCCPLYRRPETRPRSCDGRAGVRLRQGYGEEHGFGRTGVSAVLGHCDRR